MKQLYAFFLGLMFLQMQSQSTYSSADYAVIGDSIYLTSSTNFSIDFVSTGTNYSWNFSTLTGNSQEQLYFRNPNQTGYVWSFIYNTNNTNLSSTKNETNSITAFGQTLGITSNNDYYKSTSNQLIQVGNAYKIDYNGTQIPVTNQYADSDIVYNFPIDFGDADTDSSSFTISIPSVYYQNKTLQRTNEVDGWGTITTPYGTFTNALRMKTTLVENDTVSILGNGVPRVISTAQELKWFDSSKKYPVLTVTQNQVSGSWVTSKVEYLDNQTDFQTTALFAYTSLTPLAGDTVYFQNLSSNAIAYSWNFGDPSSDSLNTSTGQHPTHIFESSGTYQVQLIATNATYTDTITLPVVVGTTVNTDDYSFKNSIFVYPNPFSSKIQVANHSTDTFFYLYDISGRMLYQGKEIETQNFENLIKGYYVLISKNENQSTTHKLIKK